MPRIEYEHTFIQHAASPDSNAVMPMDVASGLTAWGADGWEIVHMEAVWHWQPLESGASHPESLHGYYVTFRREADGGSRVATMAADAEVTAGDSLSARAT